MPPAATVATSSFRRPPTDTLNADLFPMEKVVTAENYLPPGKPAKTIK